MTNSTLEKRSLPSRSDRLALLRDAGFHLTEVLKRLERLAVIEADPQNMAGWRKAVALTRQLREVCAEQEARQRAARVSRRERREMA